MMKYTNVFKCHIKRLYMLQFLNKSRSHLSLVILLSNQQLYSNSSFNCFSVSQKDSNNVLYITIFKQLQFEKALLFLCRFAQEGFIKRYEVAHNFVFRNTDKRPRNRSRSQLLQPLQGILTRTDNMYKDKRSILSNVYHIKHHPGFFINEDFRTN